MEDCQQTCTKPNKLLQSDIKDLEILIINLGINNLKSRENNGRAYQSISRSIEKIPD